MFKCYLKQLDSERDEGCIRCYDVEISHVPSLEKAVAQLMLLTSRLSVSDKSTERDISDSWIQILPHMFVADGVSLR